MFFIRLDRRPQTQFKLASQRHIEASDHVGLRIVAIQDGILTAYMLHPGKVGALSYAAIARAKTPRGSRHPFQCPCASQTCREGP